MATWNDLRQYIHSKYKVKCEEPGLIALQFETRIGRSQQVLVSHAEMNMSREQWVQIESAFAERRHVGNIWPILEHVSKYVVGGLTVSEACLCVRHAVPLADMSVEEFESPLEAVLRAADSIEAQLSPVDAW